MTNPRKPFTFAAQPHQTQPEKVEIDPNSLRDQDNAAPRVTPPLGVTKPAFNLAPPGMSGIKTSPRLATPPEKQAGIALDAAELTSHETIDGRVLTLPAYSFQARLSDENAAQNLGGGRIERLDLWKDSDLVARYDKGWQRDPPTPEAKEAVQRIRNGLDPAQSKAFTPLVNQPDKDHGQER